MASDNLKCGSPLFPPRPPSGVPRIMPPTCPPAIPRVPVLTVNGEGPDRSGNVVVEPPGLGGKADKVASATNGNFAGLDANGNLTDSGKKAGDFAPATNIAKTALASDVQTSLGKADSAVQSNDIISGGKIKSSLLPSYVDDVLEYASLANFPSPGETEKIYVAKDTNKTYRWGGSSYVEISAGVTDTATPSDSGVGGTSGLMSAVDKEKLDGIETGAQANVKPDWTAQSGSAAEILNKPSAMPPSAHTHVQSDVTGLSDALNGRPTKAQIDAGWLSGWKVFREGVDVTSQVGRLPVWVDEFGGTGWDFELSFVPTDHDDGSLLPPLTGEFESLSVSWTGYDGNMDTVHYTATRHRVAAPVPTKPEDIGAASVADATLTPVKFSEWVVVPSIYADAPIEIKWIAGSGWRPYVGGSVGTYVSVAKGDINSTSLTWTYNDGELEATAARSAVSYKLGDQTDKPIQSAGDYADSESIAPAFSSSDTYAVGDAVMHEGLRYRCTAAVSTAGAWNAANWTPEPLQTALGNVAPGPDNSKLNSTAAAPAFSTTATYDASNHVTYNGVLYECMVAYTATPSSPTPDNDIYDETTASTNHWKVTDMTTPDATLDITSAGSLRVVAANGDVLWQQGYRLVTSSTDTPGNESVSPFEFAPNASDAVALELPLLPSGRAGGFVLDVTNPALNTTSFTQSAFDSTAPYEVGDEVIYDSKIWRCVTAVETAGAWTGTTNWEEAWPYFSISGQPDRLRIVVPKGENLTDMGTFAPGTRCELHFTLTAFRDGGKPTWKVVRQDVEVVA